MSNAIQEVLLGRRTIHFYKSEPLPEGALERALEAGVHAPNHKLTNPWRFTIVGPEVRAALTEVGVQLKCGDGADEARVAKVRAKLSVPPVLVVVSQAIDADAFRRREDYAAIACAIQNMSLSLWAEGVGSKWSSGSITRAAQTYELLEIDEQVEEIVGFFWAGFPEIVPKVMPRDRGVVTRETR